MLNIADDHDGLRAKLASLGYSGLRESDESLVQALVAVKLTLSTLELSQGAQEAVLDLLSADGRQALGATPLFEEDQWMSFDYGNVKIGDFVRVKPDAYDSESGSRHNGLVGILVHMNAGKCTVKYIGRASGNKQPHPMEKLDSIRGRYNRRPS